MTVQQLGEDDFLAALEALGGCKHIGVGKPQKLDTICTPCRETVTKLVLLRESWERDPRFYEGTPKT